MEATTNQKIGPSNDRGQRTALVTGSSNGIGEAIVKRLAELDFKLVVTGRSAADIGRVADECQRLAPSRLRPREIVANLESEADVARLLEQALDHFQGRLDLLVNNAGLSVVRPPGTPAGEMFANFKRTIQVNLSSAVQLTLSARRALEQTARQCCANKPTSVICVSSIAASRPLEDYAYSVSKCALTMFSRSMSSELAPLIRVNCISPGPIETKIIERSGQSLAGFKSFVERQTPLARIGRTHEVAEAVVFLADPERASYITGCDLNVDGGSLWAHLKLN